MSCFSGLKSIFAIISKNRQDGLIKTLSEFSLKCVLWFLVYMQHLEFRVNCDVYTKAQQTPKAHYRHLHGHFSEI